MSPKHSKPDGELLNSRDAAKFLGVHPATLGNWRSYRRGPPFVEQYVGNMRFVFYRKRELEEFKKAHEH